MCAAGASGRRPDAVRTAAGRRWLVGEGALRRSGIDAGWIAHMWQDDAVLGRAHTVVHIHVLLASRLHGHMDGRPVRLAPGG